MKESLVYMTGGQKQELQKLLFKISTKDDVPAILKRIV